MDLGSRHVRIEVSAQTLRVSHQPGGPVRIVENVMVLRDASRIVAFGSTKPVGPIDPNATYRAVPLVAKDDFNLDVAEAATRHLAIETSRLGRRGWRAELERGAVDLVWPECHAVPGALRQDYLAKIGKTMDVTVNGQPAVRSSFLRGLVGRLPIIDNSASS